MKKIYISVGLVFVVVIGVYLFSQKKPVIVSTTKHAVFFGQDKILPTDIVVKITEAGFVPSEISIKKGERVVWINETSNYAWPASDPHPLHTIYPEFDPQEPLAQTEVWAFTFERVGTWGYHNHMKSIQHATVTVVSL